MTKNKKFNELLDQYTQTVLFEDLIDEASQEQVIDHFYDRYCTDNNKFLLYFTRNLRRVADQYNNLVRIETIKFDPMVTKYLEEETKRRLSKLTNGTDRTNEETSGSLQNSGIITVKTDNETTDNITTTGSLDGTDTTNTHTVVDEDTSNSTTDTIRTRDLQSNMPHSNVSSSTTGGLMANVNWRYASGMVDHGEDNTHVTTGGRDVDTTDNIGVVRSEDTENTSEGSTVLDGTQITTRGDGQTTSGSKTTSKTKNGDENTNDDTQKIYTGREGSPQELLDKARTYLRKSNAIEWLFDELEICFMPDLLYGEEW